MSKHFASLQKVLPQHFISRLVGRLAQSQDPRVSKLFIEQFARAYNISLREAERKNFGDYVSFNDFFTRALDASARPMLQAVNELASPVDGCVSQLGTITNEQLFQTKGQNYSLRGLAGEAGRGFEGGDFCTIYLAPSDYHRIHLPYAGTLTKTIAYPGALFSVNGITEEYIEGLFLRNERLVCRFETGFGPMLVVLVGALIVASIETVWPGPTSPYQSIQTDTHSLALERGAEIGRFLLGSTVICCFPKDSVRLRSTLNVGSRVRMGEVMGELAPANY
jgi:phosphatidylserine decarboxylase